MANEVDYRLIQSISESYARGQDMAYENAMRPVRMQNEFMNQRIQQLKMREAENEFLTKMGRQEAAKNAFRPAQPAQTAAPMQTGSAPSYTGNAFAQNMYGNQVETAPARPASFDTQGYVANRYGAGDIEGAQAGEDRQTALRTQKMGMYKPLYDAAVSSGNNEQFQSIVENMKREGLLPADFKAEVSPTGEVESVITITAGSVNPSTGQPWTDPVSGELIPPGQYSATAKGGRIMKVEPYVKTNTAANAEERLRIAQERLDFEKSKKAIAGDFSFGDKEIIKKTLTELPKLKREAVGGQTAITQVDRALELVAKGVTGKGGQLKSFLAPYAELAGVNTENMDDSQKYQLLTRAIIGQMRLELIGPGPVSEWEQQLMQKISGGGGATKGAAQELLGYYKTLAKAKVNSYNDTLTGFTEIYPDAGKVYKPINLGGAAPVPGTTPPKAGPVVGSVNKGYRFKGGDPAKKENWEKI